MLASNVTEETLRAAAEEIGVRIDMDPKNAKRTRWRVKLLPSRKRTILYTEPGPRGGGKRYRAKWHRRGLGFPQGSGEHPVNAVCWHGFREFFRAVYRREPNAVFRTAMAIYKGSDGFETTFLATGYKNIGSQMYPVQAREACFCADMGDDYDREWRRHCA